MGSGRVAMYAGPLQECLEAHFPEGVPMITFDGKEGRCHYPAK